MAKTVVVVKDGAKKTVLEEYKNDYIIAGWVEEPEKDKAEPSTYNYNAKI